MGLLGSMVVVGLLGSAVDLVSSLETVVFSVWAASEVNVDWSEGLVDCVVAVSGVGFDVSVFDDDSVASVLEEDFAESTVVALVCDSSVEDFVESSVDFTGAVVCFEDCVKSVGIFHVYFFMFLYVLSFY